MKIQTYILLLLIMCSCSKTPTVLLGQWKVESKYYQATYAIIEDNDSIKAKVLYYNDGTTIVREKDQKDYYVFKNLKYTNNRYVDAVSGATKVKEIQPSIELNPIHKDTLKITKYIRNKPLKEVWTRINK